MPLISVTSGQESFTPPAVSASVYWNYRKKPHSDEFTSMVAISNKELGVNKISSSASNACSHNRNHGMWITNRLELPEQSILNFYVQYFGRGTGFEKIIRYRFLLLMRESAAYRKLGIQLTNHPKADMSRSYVEGNFDIVSVDLFDKLNIANIGPGILHEYDRELFERFVSSEVLGKEKTSLLAMQSPAVKETVSGKKVLIKKPTGRVVNI